MPKDVLGHLPFTEFGSSRANKERKTDLYKNSLFQHDVGKSTGVLQNEFIHVP